MTDSDFPLVRADLLSPVLRIPDDGAAVDLDAVIEREDC